ncbi:MAG: hypothetical protein KDD25_03030 [Bdellovibrionales bacterium]|nr:hypothetical protein [Bdellovibrionales bacterium]
MKLFLALLLAISFSGCGKNVDNIDKNSEEMSQELKEIKAQMKVLNEFLGVLAKAGLSLDQFMTAMMASLQKGQGEVDDDDFDMDDYFPDENSNGSGGN